MIEDQSNAGHPFFAETDIAQLYREANGTVVLRFCQGARLHVENTTKVTDLHVQAANQTRCPTLADVRGMRYVSQPVRELVTGPKLAAVNLRLAILVGNPVTRVLANFFARVSGLQYPVRVFDDESVARRWLAQSDV